MYDNFNKATIHIYNINLKDYYKDEMPSGDEMTREEFEHANVNVTVQQMVMNCGYVLEEIIFYRKRIFGVGNSPHKILLYITYLHLIFNY
jgi:hypothetical protein